MSCWEAEYFPKQNSPATDMRLTETPLEQTPPLSHQAVAPPAMRSDPRIGDIVQTTTRPKMRPVTEAFLGAIAVIATLFAVGFLKMAVEDFLMPHLGHNAFIQWLIEILALNRTTQDADVELDLALLWGAAAALSIYKLVSAKRTPRHGKLTIEEEWHRSLVPVVTCFLFAAVMFISWRKGDWLPMMKVTYLVTSAFGVCCGIYSLFCGRSRVDRYLSLFCVVGIAVAFYWLLQYSSIDFLPPSR